MSMNELTVKLTPFVATIPELTPDMVAEAKRKAKQAIIDQQVKPKRSDFDDVVISRYPPRIVRFTVFVLVTLFLTSIIPSAFHIFEVATSYPKTAINSASILSGFMNIAQHSISWQKAIIGICTVIGSEMAVMGLAIASQVFFDGNKDMQRLFNVPIFMALGFAYVGNWIAVAPQGVGDIFGILLAVAPPTFVLFISYFGKVLAVDYVQTQYGGEKQYQEALKRYQDSIDKADLDPAFMEYFHRYLKGYIELTITKGAGAGARRKYIASLSADEKRHLYLMLSNRAMDAGNGEFVRIAIPDGARANAVSVSSSYGALGDGQAVVKSNIQSDIQIQSIQNEPKLNGMNELNIEKPKKRSPKSEKAYQMIKDNPQYLTMKIEDVANAIGVSVGTAHAVITQLRSEQ